MNKDIERLRRDTQVIINENPSTVTIHRKVAVKEDGEIVKYEIKSIGSEKVRMIPTPQGAIRQLTKDGNYIEISKYLLITEYNSKIMKDDILEDDKDHFFRVSFINEYKLYGLCFKKDGDIELIKDV